MVLGGLWHGARWNFVLWGFLHGLALILQRIVGRKFFPGRVLSTILTFLFVSLCWVPFRCAGPGQTLTYLRRLCGWGGWEGQSFFSNAFWICWLLICFGHLLGVWLEKKGRGQQLPLAGRYLCLRRLDFLSGFLLTLWLGVLFLFGATQAQPFVYFQF